MGTRLVMEVLLLQEIRPGPGNSGPKARLELLELRHLEVGVLFPVHANKLPILRNGMHECLTAAIKGPNIPVP